MTTAAGNTKATLKLRALTVLAAVFAAIVLPQLVHAAGIITGTGSAPGEALLPMHIPVILSGLIAGPAAGALCGILSPLLSFFLTGMPGSAILPFMLIELCAYGFFAGILQNVKLPCVFKVLLTQAAGRVLKVIAVLAAVCVFNSSAVTVAIIWRSVLTGIYGIALQLILIPVIMGIAERKKI